MGEESQNGDAILLRYVHDGKWVVGLIDGGFKATADDIVSHMEKYYGTSTIDWVLNTHPDQDHTSGLIELLDKCEVKKLWMHEPWELVAGIEDSVSIGKDLYDKAEGMGITICAPYAGSYNGEYFTVLSPTPEFYLEQLQVIAGNETPRGKASFIERALFFIREAWEGSETLKEDPVTSAKNETSVVLFGEYELDEGHHRVILTGDAGIKALEKVHNYAVSNNLRIASPDFLQAPHHGSRHNVSPTRLNELLGDRLDDENRKRGVAFVSAAKNSGSHPYRSVVNALNRRGYRTFQTKGKNLRHRAGKTPERPSYSTATPLGFFSEVEPYDE